MPFQPEDYEDLHDMLAQQFAAGGNMQLAQSRPQMEPSEQELRQLLQAKMMESMKKQQANIGASEKALAEEQAKPRQVDISPLFGLAKVAGGDDSGAKNYTKPEDNDEKLRLLRAEVSKNQGALTDDQINYLKAQLKNRADDRISLGQQRLGLSEKRLNEQVYGKVVKGIQDDPVLKDLIGKNNNISRTIDVVFAPGQKKSSSSLHDLQQTVTGALTSLASSGGVGERDKRYIETYNNRWQHLMQNMGDLDSIPDDDPTLMHFLSLAKEGQSYIEKQARQRMHAKSVGHENITDLPTYKPMLKNAMGEIEGSIMRPQYAGKDTPTEALIIQKNRGIVDPAASGTAAAEEGGMTPAQLKRLQELEAKHGAQ